MDGHRQDDITVYELVDRFLEHADVYCRQDDGTHSSYLRNFKRVIKILCELYGHRKATEFSPRSFKALLRKLVERDLCRRSCEAEC